MTEVKNSDYFKTTISYSRDSGCADIRVHRDGETKYYPSADGKCLATGTYTIGEDGTVASGAPTEIQHTATMYFKPTATVSKVWMHYRGSPATGSTGWTDAPGVQMESAGSGWYKLTNTYDIANTGVEFLFNDCGSSWYKAAAGGNFTVTTIDDYNVNGTSLSEGAPEELVGTVNKAPTAKVSPEAATITSGETVTLDASGSTDSDGTIASYKWSTGETTSSIKVSPTATTTYTVTVTDNSGASASKSVKVTVGSTSNKVPVAKITTASTVVTSGSEIVLSGATSYDSDGSIASYKWSTGETTSTIKVKVTTDTTYSLEVTDNSGAVSEVVYIKISVASVANNAPKAVITASTNSINLGETVVLDGKSSTDSDGSIASYKWSTGETSASIVVSPTASTRYSLVVTDNLGAVSEKVYVTISVNNVANHTPNAVVTASTSGPILAGSSVILFGEYW